MESELPPNDGESVNDATFAPPENTEKAERALRKKQAQKLGWKLVGSDAEIKVERSFIIGPRTVIVRGRVSVEMPDELTKEAGDAAIEPIVNPAAAKFQNSMERAVTKILREPDDVGKRRIFEASSFFTALEQAQRGLVRDYQELANKRIDDHVEANLGLRFYLESFTHTERKFLYFAGPTNSGKTHAAIELLRNSASGVYLAPLRLLALEIYERLTELAVPASLITGEERMIHPDARHVSSTVEMVDLNRDMDVAIIDEAQMLQDDQRGWAWTLAIAGVRAKTVVMCGSEDGLHAAQKLADKLGVTIEVHRFERKNKLHVVDAIGLNQLKPGDAVVAFSRKAVVELQSQISRTGRSTAAIYGSLSPVVRRNEADRFRSGAADVLVATDAIGLGLNLPISRLIFAAIEKYDGVKSRQLAPPEIRQIAGRAGRYGMHEEGQVSALDARWIPILKRHLEPQAAPPEDLPIWISPTDDHLKRLAEILHTDRISRLLQFFQTRVLRDGNSDLRITDLSASIDVAVALEMSENFNRLPLGIRSTYSRAPVPNRGPGLEILSRWADQHARHGAVLGEELIKELAARDKLLLFEDRSRLATLYLWLALRFPTTYLNAEEIVEIRERTDGDIQNALLQAGERIKQRKPQQQQPQQKPMLRRKPPQTFNKKRLPR